MRLDVLSTARNFYEELVCHPNTDMMFHTKVIQLLQPSAFVLN